MTSSFLILVAFLGLFLSSTLAVESDFERNLTIALNKASQQLKKDNSTQLTTSCYEKFGTDFGCPLFSHSDGRPDSVHKLTPYDIDYVAALGDSITAAMGAAACTIVDGLMSFRGESWSIGGDSDLDKVTTLPNIIRKYNSEVEGYSIKTGGPDSKNAKYNKAVIGAIAQDMPDQARLLVEQMKGDLGDDKFNNAWKLVTLWIGGNNLCAYCNNKEKHSTANYVDNIAEALDILRDELPRTFVNLVQIIDVTRLEPIHGLVCDAVHNAVCKCGSEADKIDETSAQSTAYQEALIELVATDRYDSKDDFAVVLQPFFEGIELPYKDDEPDKSYFAPDCFHFSTKGHTEAAKALWKNMIEPVGSKTSGWELGGPLSCPTEEHKYFYTKKNSPPPSLYGTSNQGGPAAGVTQDDTNNNNNNNNNNGHFSAIITSSTIGVAIMVVTIVIGTVLVALKMKKKDKRREVERLPLVNENFY